MSMVKCKECTTDISTRANTCPQCGAPTRKKISTFNGVLLILLLLWVIGYVSNGGNTPKASTGPSEPSLSEISIRNVKLDYSWSKGGFDNVMEATFVINNANSHPVKDIEIECIHYANSGTRIDSNKRTLFEIVPANSKRTFSKFNMGFIHTQAAHSSCEITNLVAS